MASHFPQYLRKSHIFARQNRKVEDLLSSLHISSVCHSARCPNRNECFARGTATFLLLGEVCTRNCRFCAIKAGRPQPPDPCEPERIAQAAAILNLKHIVLTSVTRDDLKDGGAEHICKTTLAVRARLPESTIEVLTPDFLGSNEALDTVLSAKPDVFNHNIETVPRLYEVVRPGADYERSLSLIRAAKRLSPDVVTKSGMMLGLGETPDEIISTMSDLRRNGCEILTLGQYITPGAGYYEIREFIEPEKFDRYARLGREMGFLYVAAGPFVRSSYMAREALDAALAHRDVEIVNCKL